MQPGYREKSTKQMVTESPNSAWCGSVTDRAASVATRTPFIHIYAACRRYMHPVWLTTASLMLVTSPSSFSFQYTVVLNSNSELAALSVGVFNNANRLS
jgi:hypothetical protein